MAQFFSRLLTLSSLILFLVNYCITYRSFALSFSPVVLGDVCHTLRRSCNFSVYTDVVWKPRKKSLHVGTPLLSSSPAAGTVISIMKHSARAHEPTHRALSYSVCRSLCAFYASSFSLCQSIFSFYPCLSFSHLVSF